MPRKLDPLSIAELDKDGQYIFHMVELVVDEDDASETLRYTDAHAPIDFGGYTYTPTSNLLNFGNVTETEALVLNSMTFNFSGVDLTLFAIVLQQDLVNRPVNLIQGLIDPATYQVVDSPITIYRGRVKSSTLRETPGDKAVLKLNTASVLADFNKTTGRRANTEDQRLYLTIKGRLNASDAVSRGMGTVSGTTFTPTVDLGFDEAHKSTLDVKWGRA